jgi:hypothetical protein
MSLKTYICNTRISHDGKDYKIGDKIELSSGAFGALPKGAVAEQTEEAERQEAERLAAEEAPTQAEAARLAAEEAQQQAAETNIATCQKRKTVHATEGTAANKDAGGRGGPDRKVGS